VRYALLSFTVPNALDALTDEERQRWLDDDAKFNAELAERDCVVGGEPLADPTTATTVRVDDGGRASLTDGPFAETAEVLGGVLVIDVEDLDEALDIAARCPAARLGPLEVRPIRTAFG
jgi:hypothetical protein